MHTFQNSKNKGNLQQNNLSEKVCMFEELQFQHSHNHSSTDNSKKNRNSENKSKKIRKEKQIVKDQLEQKYESHSFLTKEQKKLVQKEKNRVAAQLSRDRQKKYVEDLQQQLKVLEKTLQQRVCPKCRTKLQQNSTSEDQNSMNIYPPIILETKNQVDGLLNEEPQIEELSYFRIPFDRSDFGFSSKKVGNIFCLSMLIFAIICFSGSVDHAPNGLIQERRLMQVMEDTCDMAKQQPLNVENTLPTLGYLSENWSFSSNQSDPIESCKNQFWETYLKTARQDTKVPKNLVNCNKPSIVRISNPYDQQEPTDQWTFLISDPSITNAHISEKGEFLVDEVSYLNGVYQLISQKVVLKKVIGENCLA